jgi:predicted double-glycine peptidase
MAKFHLLTRTRQMTEYSCGASALQAVLHYWGRDIDEAGLMRLMGTSEDVGTYPENIARGVLELGLQAEVRDNLTLDEVQRFTAEVGPMIALGQVWRSQKSADVAPEDEWDNGHYIVVLGVDAQNVYFQDPYLTMGKVVVTRRMFERHWHQIMGGAAAQNPKLMHLGIMIRGERPAAPDAPRAIDPATLDFAKLGSFNLMVTDFDRVLMPFDFMDELREVWASGQVRPDAVVLLSKSADGDIMAMEGGRLEEEHEVAEISVVLGALASRALGSPQGARAAAEQALEAVGAGDFGLSADYLGALAARLEPGRSVMVTLFENVWERRFREVARKYGGAVREQRLVDSGTVAAAARRLLP